jgi:hypothetical protein
MVRSLRITGVVRSASHGRILSQHPDGKGTAVVVDPKLVKVSKRLGRQAVVGVAVCIGQQLVGPDTERTGEQEELVQRDVLRSALDVGDRSAPEPNTLGQEPLRQPCIETRLPQRVPERAVKVVHVTEYADDQGRCQCG